MKPRRKAALLLALCGSLLLTAGVLAMSSDNYAINWDVMGGGGSAISSNSYSMNSTIGQAVIGAKSSMSYQLGSGYWYGIVAIEVGPFRIYLPIILKNFRP